LPKVESPSACGPSDDADYADAETGNERNFTTTMRPYSSVLERVGSEINEECEQTHITENNLVLGVSGFCTRPGADRKEQRQTASIALGYLQESRAAPGASVRRAERHGYFPADRRRRQGRQKRTATCALA
jgi:hypothetical protein